MRFSRSIEHLGKHAIEEGMDCRDMQTMALGQSGEVFNNGMKLYFFKSCLVISQSKYVQTKFLYSGSYQKL